MTKIPQIAQDDIIDVMEMTQKIEKSINRILKDNEVHLAVSALMSATINCLAHQCHSLDEVIFYRNIFTRLLDNSIQDIKTQVSENPEDDQNS